ncbi:glucosaminidase domain-containing protein [Cohnella xylanilytica]|uniref:Glucosaminidase domain-containing protein n=1 Tax=Cohnella xylanilytica TaxID=557555 RepID=A0A841TNQ9_9BACL|nr:glucosaminidase domain-containing protein [Cohnella xylanilytica]MBB6689897.1 glucosaminidase domain-containing protein [Cohnella xylanilytica]
MPNYTKYSKDAFIALIAPTVMQVHREGGRLLPSVRIAQSWLETGGKVPEWFNLGGYKVGSGKPTAYWDGSSVSTETKEVYNGVTVNTTANWRAYKSIYHYFKDQDLLFDRSRYDRVRAAKTPKEQCTALKACGYATDPGYAGKLMSVITANGLTKYDAPVATGGEDTPMTNEEKKAFDKLREDVAAIKLSMEAVTKLVPAPVWFTKEFGSGDLGGLVSNPNFTEEGWRTLAVALRAFKKH